MWNSGCSPCPHRARRAAHCMWSAFIFHGQVQSAICPCEVAGKPQQGKLHSWGVFITDPQNPSQALGLPLQEGDFCGIHSSPTCLHFSKSEDTGFTVHCLHHRAAFSVRCSTRSTSQDTTQVTHICVCHWMGPLLAQAPCQAFTLSNRISGAVPQLLSVKTCKPPQVPGPPLCPKVTKPKLPRVPHVFAQTTYPSWPTLPEYMVNTLWSHIRGPLRKSCPGP